MRVPLRGHFVDIRLELLSHHGSLKELAKIRLSIARVFAPLFLSVYPFSRRSLDGVRNFSGPCLSAETAVLIQSATVFASYRPRQLPLSAL